MTKNEKLALKRTAEPLAYGLSAAAAIYLITHYLPKEVAALIFLGALVAFTIWFLVYIYKDNLQRIEFAERHNLEK